MGISYSFMDNCTYGADDINSAFSKLTTQGVSMFLYSEGDNPLISLNDAVSSIASPGVEYYNFDACKVTYDAENKKYYIMQGNAFMHDGTIVSIDNEGYDITDEVNGIRATSDNDIYVCFYRDVANNCISVSVSQSDEIINKDESVPLSIIQGTQNIGDLREFATTKLAACSGNIICGGRIESFRILPYEDTAAEMLRATFTGIFPGAQYVVCYSNVIPVQKTGNYDELDFTSIEISGHCVNIAISQVGTEMKVWMYCFVTNHLLPATDCIIF